MPRLQKRDGGERRDDRQWWENDVKQRDCKYSNKNIAVLTSRATFPNSDKAIMQWKRIAWSTFQL